jgi:hypothetical protein
MTATVQFFDSDVPPIKGGDFVITVTQTASAIAPDIPPAQQKITFSAPQVTLDPAEVVQCSPPPSATGPFGDVLASVLLAEPSLPWERSMPAENCPWLALLVFADGELSGGDPATHAVTGTVAEFLAIKDAVVPKITLEADVAPSQACSYIRVPAGLFTDVTPRASELPWLAHVRRSVPDSGPATELGVVMANRFPAVPAADAPAPAAAVAHLVSVEGLTPWLTDDPVFTASGTADGTLALGSVVMLSLASWTFGVVPEPAESFQGLTLSLLDAEYDPATGQHSPDLLALRLPLPPGYGPGAPDPGQAEVGARLTGGYVPLTYHARSGEEAMAWYRGPVTPALVATLDPPLPLPTADAALIYDAAHGVFDVSLAAAWQIGRAAALADRSFGQALFSYRQTVQQLGDVVVDRVARPQFADEPSTDLHGLAGQALGALHAVLGREIGGPVPDSGQETGAPAGRSRLRAQPAPAGRPLLAALADPAVQQAVTDLAADALVPVAQWLAELTLLEPLPFTCLVPDPRMLPRVTPSAADPDASLPGAIRFGYIDPNWITALVTGALSLAVESSRQAGTPGTIDPAVQAAIGAALAQRCGLSQPPAGPVSVLLLRSDLVSGWPTLTVTPLDATGAAVPVLRLDRLAPGVLLALFDGIPASVRLAEPHAALTLGLDEQGAAELRNLRPPPGDGDPPVGAPLGRTVPVLATPACLRPGGRVLAVAGLVTTIRTALSGQGQPVGAFGPAALALQLVRAPQEMTFDSAAGGS